MDSLGYPFHLLRPAHSYARTAPTLFEFDARDEELRSYILETLSQPTAPAAEEGYIELNDCIISNGMQVITQELEWLPPSLDDYPDKHRLGEFVEIIRSVGCETYPTDERTNVVIGKFGAHNYGHFLSDILPKLMHVIRANLGPIRLHLPTVPESYVRSIKDLLALHDINAVVVQWPEHSLIAFYHALVFTPVSRHQHSKSVTLLELRAELLKLYDAGGSTPHRIYVARPLGERRSLVNAAEVEYAFTQRGFTVVYPGAMSVGEQAHLFSQATHIAGALGAGLANMLFAPQHAQTFMIDPGLMDQYFWDLSALIGQRFHWFLAGQVRGHSNTLVESPFEVDVTKLRSALDSVAW